MKIEILGTGCAKCETLAANAEAAAQKLGLDYELVKVKNLAQIAKYGVLITPGLVIDGEVKLSGRMADQTELEILFKAANEQ